MDIPRFKECTCCKRSIVIGSSLWSDEDKRICKCCECIGYENSILLCRRQNCGLYKYIDNDFIIEVDEVKQSIGVESSQPVENYDEASNKCYRCNKELTSFLYLNLKVTKFDIKNEIEAKSNNKIKVKLCDHCASEFLKYLPIKLIKEEDVSK